MTGCNERSSVAVNRLAADQALAAVDFVIRRRRSPGFPSAAPYGHDVQPHAHFFQSYAGNLDSRGNASAGIAIPNLTSLTGMELLTGFMVFHVADPAETVQFSNTVATKIVR